MNPKKPIPSAPLSEVAYQQIKEMIVNVKLRPGEQVDEGGLASTLSIGRTPIREALFRLVAEELLQVRQGRGFVVRDVTLSDLKDLFEALLILERSAAALAARRINAEQIRALEGINADFKKAWKKNDFIQVTLVNSRFHRGIYEAAGNTFLNSYLNSLQNQSQRLAYLCYSKPAASIDLESHGEHSIRDHARLIECFAAGDEAGAVQTITEHIRLFQNRVNDFATPSVMEMNLFA
ncbi:GntR family transcriptional regulator [Desulfococcus sp.]|uniref:GntR family transcriptional regulator n=1 Tax=Desulfococcus sp. TaxID=2025834 RepID=UPI0035944453